MNTDSELKKFAIKLTVLILGTATFLFSLYFLSQAVKPVDHNEYMLALLDKDGILMEKSKTERIIFVGGSNLAFGLDSEKIETAFHKKTINMGLAYDLGLKFMLNNLESNLRDGDVVIITPEYQNFFGGGINGGRALADMVFYLEPQKFWSLDLAQMFGAGMYLPQIILEKIEGGVKEKITGSTTLESSINQRKNFNKYGDMIGHLGLPNEKIGDDFYDGQKLDSEVSPFINEFAGKMYGRDIKFFFLYPNYRKSDYEKYKSLVDKVESNVSSRLKIPLLGNPEEYVFDDSYFFNSAYHLNKEGRALRTEMIIDALQKVI